MDAGSETGATIDQSSRTVHAATPNGEAVSTTIGKFKDLRKFWPASSH